ncbi:MAG: 1-(5-phosphoribosyl)-5-[(5-phosphoribosylamino)methylideneamino]imidazole-4-carboxamide isomerase [Thermodesulfobacteriota bacterium]|nr:1-(5-phosphoribosyl)-5-[(5-phosphoribosylamino)methylideneamino]imidazole-4-carboxamide isomerase [Thermodesulfobacteriota bacterium]
MIVIPAVDIKGGKCVRLRQGLMDEETIFSDNPEEMALKWQEKGAKRLHLVDLDGAVNGETSNKKVVQNIVKMVSVPVQLGGGIRNMKTIGEYIDMGIDQVILGTVAYKNPDLVDEACKRYENKIIVSIDSKDGYISIEGWTEPTQMAAIDLAKNFENMGVNSIIYTDIKRDGMESGPNLDAIKKFAGALNMKVIAAGGISTLKDIEDLSLLEKYGVNGAIVGKALYSGSIKLEEVIAAVD